MIINGQHLELPCEAANCSGNYKAWLGQVRSCEWRSEEELRLRFPRCVRVTGIRYHFPLNAELFGVRAYVNFARSGRPGMVQLIEFAAAPTTVSPAQAPAAASRPARHLSASSVPANNTK
ncbi:hypothetical protein [Haloferula sp.]|uniref:hypothetical protein n=1 Tax=Haloferula sp. TaxID=2497595 RepID=UPI003C7940E7